MFAKAAFGLALVLATASGGMAVSWHGTSGVLGAILGASGQASAAMSLPGDLFGVDSMGHALYCPFGLSVAVPAMVWTHLLVAGPAEAIITVAALATTAGPTR